MVVILGVVTGCAENYRGHEPLTIFSSKYDNSTPEIISFSCLIYSRSIASEIIESINNSIPNTIRVNPYLIIVPYL